MIGLITGTGVVFLLLYLGKNKRKKTEELLNTEKVTKNGDKNKVFSLIQKPFVKWVLWIAAIWFLGCWFFDSPSFNPKTSFWIGVEKIKAQAQISQQTQAEEGITFAPGEMKKVIQLEPGKWTRWIITPPGTGWRYDATNYIEEVLFSDGSRYKDKPSQFRDCGVKRGIFKFRGEGEVIVTISLQN